MNLNVKNSSLIRNIIKPFVNSKSSGSSIAGQTIEPKPLKSEVLNLYKNLIYLSKEWPTDLRPQIKDAFMKNRDKTDAEEIRALIGRGEYVCKEIIATYHLRKYRAMKRRYYSDGDNKHLEKLFKSFNT